MPHAAGMVALIPAVVAALKARAQLVALLDSAAAVYEGRAPNPTSGAQPSKYVVVTTPTYVPTAVLHSDGADNGLELHIWYPGGRNVPVVAIVNEIAIALDGVALTLAGARHWTGETQLIAITDDTSITPSGKHGIVQYFSRTQ
jgi:hypothetical protein